MMRTLEIESPASSTGWTIEVSDLLESKIAGTLGVDVDTLTDEEIKRFVLDNLMTEREMLSLQVVENIPS